MRGSPGDWIFIRTRLNPIRVFFVVFFARVFVFPDATPGPLCIVQVDFLWGSLS